MKPVKLKQTELLQSYFPSNLGRSFLSSNLKVKANYEEAKLWLTVSRVVVLGSVDLTATYWSGNDIGSCDVERISTEDSGTCSPDL